MIRTAAVVALGLAAGPVFAGDSIMWGESSPNGAVRVMTVAPGGEPLLVHRVPPPTARRTRRGFGGEGAEFASLAASRDRFAAHIFTAKGEGIDDDFAVTEAVIGGRFKQPVEVVSGSIPVRVRRPCERGRRPWQPVLAIDVDGDRTAVGGFTQECGEDAWRESITVFDGATATTIPVGTAGVIRDVALAGRYLAWTRESRPDEIVVRDLESGVDVLRVSGRDLGAVYVTDVALQEDGTVAFMYGAGDAFVAWARPGTPGVRRLDRAEPFLGLAMSDGRVMYYRSRPLGRGLLLLRPLSGGPSRVLARFRGHGDRAGDLDLDATRAVWAVRPQHGPERIVIRDL